MKKIMTILLMVAMMMGFMSTTAFATTESKIGFILDNKDQTWDSSYGSLFVKDGRTFIPLRAVSEKLGYSVHWNSKTNSADLTKGTDTISFVIGKKEVTTKNGVVTLDVASFVMNGRTYVPMRGMFEAVGSKVEWLSSKVIAQQLGVMITEMKSDFYVVVTGGSTTPTPTTTTTTTTTNETAFATATGDLKQEFWKDLFAKTVPTNTPTYYSESLALIGQSTWSSEWNSDLSVSRYQGEIRITIQGSHLDYIKASVLESLKAVSKSDADAKEIYDRFAKEAITESWVKAKDGTQYRASNEAGYGVTIHINVVK